MDAGHQSSTRSLALRGWTRSLYVGVLLAVATYAALILLWPASQPSCVAECAVRLRAASSAGRLPALSAHELALLCGIQPSGPVRIETTASASGMRIRLIATASSPRAAMQLLDGSAQQFLEGAPAYVGARTNDCRDQPSDQREEGCWTALQAQLHRIVECAEMLSSDECLVDGDNSAANETLRVSTSADQSGSELNPEWIKANNEREAERERLDALLKTRTAQHPEVQAARDNIERLTGRLDQIPLLAPPAGESADDSATQANHEVNTSLTDMLTNLRQGIGQLDSAKDELKSAFDDYSNARSTVREQKDVRPPLPLWFAETCRPASLTQRSHGRGPASHPELLLIAISSAVVLTRLVAPNGKQVLENIADARGWGAQVVAVFGDVQAPRIAGTEEWTPPIAQIARWAVLVLLAMSLILAVSDPLFVGNLCHDPAMAIRDAWQHWLLR